MGMAEEILNGILIKEIYIYQFLLTLIEIFKKYKLEEVAQAHKDLESRKIIGPAVIIP